MNLKVYIISGTGTDVGKTYATATLAASEIHAGKKVGICKPIQTGTDTLETDPHWITTHVQGLHRLPPEQEILYHFPFPAAPDYAARKIQQRIDFDELCAKIRAVVDAHKETLDVLFIELAGGLMVPINDEKFNLDLIQSLGYPTILVTPAGLGMLSHALLSLRALQSINANIAGYVVNRISVPADELETDNLHVLQKWAGVPYLTVIPDAPVIQPILSLQL